MKIAGVAPPPKSWAWSYSKLKNYNTCPKRHYEIDLAKNYVDSGPGLAEGNAAHDALAKACSRVASLPVHYSHWQKWVDKVHALQEGKLLVEQKYAINRDLEARKYFDKDVWFRAIGDVVWFDRETDPLIALILDWKTGKVLEDPPQLMLTALCLFAHYPTLRRVRSEFVWLKDECTTPEVFTKAEVGQSFMKLLPQVKALEKAHIEQSYPPKPNGLCKKYCMVTSCPFHGKGARG